MEGHVEELVHFGLKSDYYWWNGKKYVEKRLLLYAFIFAWASIMKTIHDKKKKHFLAPFQYNILGGVKCQLEYYCFNILQSKFRHNFTNSLSEMIVQCIFKNFKFL